MTPASPSRTRIKAQWLRAYAELFAGDERFRNIAALVPADTAALGTTPPAPAAACSTSPTPTPPRWPHSSFSSLGCRTSSTWAASSARFKIQW